MSDEIERLRAEMARATPAPDPARRAENLRVAQENFDALQGTRREARPTERRPLMARLLDGVTTMIDRISPRGAMAATTAMVAVGALVVLPTDLLLPEEEVILFEPEPIVQEPAIAPRPAELQTLAETDSATAVRPSITATPQSLSRTQSALSDAATEGFAAGAPLAQRRTVPVPDDQVIQIVPDTEAFANAETNPLKSVIEEPVSTFSIDVDTASYSVVRSSLTRGQMPPAEAVRIEEMVNYFPYAYPAPEGDAPFQPTVTVLPTPWNADTNLVHIGIQGALPATDERPPLNLVFLIDTSGSMQDATKLPLLKQSFRMMLGELRPEDQVAIVTYAGSAGRVLDPTPASDRATIEAALGRLEAGGSTAGQAGLQQAYATADEMAEEGEVTRVILATDGDFNVGLSDPEALKDFIANQRDSGTYLSVLGFGRGNLDDATMQALAQNGNGQAAYIDTLSEARKVLVDQLTGALFPIANDVKIQIEFNPATIAEYRLIGYETRALRREDFNNDAVDAGEIGAGHQVTAIYEVTPVGSPAVRIDDLRYGTSEVTATSDEIGFLRMRYKTPGAAESQLIETPVMPGQGTVSDDIRFSAAIAGFGQLLRDGTYLGDWGYADAIALANGARGEDPFGYRTEAVTLMRLAESLDRN
ncbi:MAG: VWA domain-containing protein [Pseudomonadota bacterium]